MRIIQLTFALFLGLVVLAPRAHAATPTTFHAVLIMASNEKTPADPRLSPYENALQRNLPESSFRFVAESSASVPAEGRGTIRLSGGHRIELEGAKRTDDGILANVQWLNSRTLEIGGSFTFKRGVPIVLGRRPSGNGDVPIVVLIAK